MCNGCNYNNNVIDYMKKEQENRYAPKYMFDGIMPDYIATINNSRLNMFSNRYTKEYK